MGSREVPFSREIYIEKTDFLENPPSKFFRLKPGGEVRLMGSYVVKCEDFVKDENGEVIEVKCTYDPETKGQNPPDGRKIKGTIHWVSAAQAFDATIHMYDKLFTIENVNAIPEDKTYDDYLNPESKKVYANCKMEPSLKDAKPGERFQFVRIGYFCKDTKYDNVFGSIVNLKDSYAKKK